MVLTKQTLSLNISPFPPFLCSYPCNGKTQACRTRACAHPQAKPGVGPPLLAEPTPPSHAKVNYETPKVMNFEAVMNQGFFLLPKVLSHREILRFCFQAFPTGKSEESMLTLKEVICKSPVKQETPRKISEISCPFQGQQQEQTAAALCYIP